MQTIHYVQSLLAWLTVPSCSLGFLLRLAGHSGRAPGLDAAEEGHNLQTGSRKKTVTISIACSWTKALKSS